MTPNDADVQIIADLYHTELRTLLKSNRKNRKSRQPDPVKLMLEYSVSERVHVHEPGPGPGRTWIWSDLHLRHANIIKYCSRPFADADTMDRLLMEQWNQNVDPGDTLLNGGDVVHGGRVREADRVALRAAPGRKVLVIGNHDFHRRTGELERAEHDVVTGIRRTRPMKRDQLPEPAMRLWRDHGDILVAELGKLEPPMWQLGGGTLPRKGVDAPPQLRTRHHDTDRWIQAHGASCARRHRDQTPKTGTRRNQQPRGKAPEGEDRSRRQLRKQVRYRHPGPRPRTTRIRTSRTNLRNECQQAVRRADHTQQAPARPDESGQGCVRHPTTPTGPTQQPSRRGGTSHSRWARAPDSPPVAPRPPASWAAWAAPPAGLSLPNPRVRHAPPVGCLNPGSACRRRCPRPIPAPITPFGGRIWTFVNNAG